MRPEKIGRPQKTSYGYVVSVKYVGMTPMQYKFTAGKGGGVVVTAPDGTVHEVRNPQRFGESLTVEWVAAFMGAAVSGA